MAENDDYISPLTSAFKLRWDVFLSFRGEDTRQYFTSILFQALDSAGVQVFKDNNVLVQGDDIAGGLLEAIEYSSAAVAIISSGYASSRWCLEELAKICECGRLVLPVFYRVDPSDVRRQAGPFEKDFERLEKKFGVEEVVRWRKAMESVGGKVGWVCHSRDEPELVQSIVKRVLSEVVNSPIIVAPFHVGLDSRVQELMELLNAKRNGVQVLGLHGMGGIGKTTLAKALFNKLAKHFELRSFILNVRETNLRYGNAVSVQNNLIQSLFPGTPPVQDERSGIMAIKRIFQENRILLVLDDVENPEQLKPLIGQQGWLSEGSRIIVSTRNVDVLQEDFVTEMYEVKELDSSDSLKLFSYYALRREKPTQTRLHLSKDIVRLTGGLPLALEVFGSFLFNKKESEWRDALHKLKQIRPNNLQSVLSISFDALDREDQCIFLDIACLFLNLEMKRVDVCDVLRGCGYRSEAAIATLVSRSLVKVIENDGLYMHDQIRDMGRQIVVDEDFSNPGKRSRLWVGGDVVNVLQSMKGSQEIEGIVLDLEKKNFNRIISAKTIAWNQLTRTPNFTSAVAYIQEIYKDFFQNGSKKDGELLLCTASFKSMVNLRLLQLSNVKLEGNFQEFPTSLKWLQWKKCSLENLPSDFCPKELGVLDLSESKINRVWGWSLWRWSWIRHKPASKLKVLNLHGCYNITETPDLSAHQALSKLILARCNSLERIHKSVSNLNSLCYLNLRDCRNLAKFPSDVSRLKQLEVLILSGCARLIDLPENLGNMISLRELFLDETNIERLPDSMFHLTRLEKLSLSGCYKLKQLPKCIGTLASLRELSLQNSALEQIPDSIGSLRNLETFDLRWCRLLPVIPDSIGNLKSLTKFWLNKSSVKVLPESIGSVHYLKELIIGECLGMCTLPDSVKHLASMVKLELDQTRIARLPDQIGALKSLKKLEMRNCLNLCSLPESIGNLPLNELIIINAVITELPESIGMLENLIFLNLTKCKLLVTLPKSIGQLKNLRRLLMGETSVTYLPESFGMLSRLLVLRMGKKPFAPGHQIVAQPKQIILPCSFCNLASLEEFDARAWKISGKIADEFEKLSLLEILNLGYNDFTYLPTSLRGLSILRKLFLPHCKRLRFLPPLPSSLLELNVANCIELEGISSLSNLEHLQELNFSNCQKLGDVPGLEFLKSLRRLHMSGCCSRASLAVRKLGKVALKKLYNLSFCGSEIPDWFTQGKICVKNSGNNLIKGIIIGVVVSVNRETPDSLRDELPVIPDIYARIIRVNKPVFTSALFLVGVPTTDENQLYLCRYEDHHPLVSILEDGDSIEVVRRNPPAVQGVELKKSGIHLISEINDDFEGDEELLNESQYSVSEGLRRFMDVSEEQDSMSISEVRRTEPECRFCCLEGIFGAFRSFFIWRS